MAWKIDQRLHDPGLHDLGIEPDSYDVNPASPAISDRNASAELLAMTPNRRSVWPESDVGSSSTPTFGGLARTVGYKRRQKEVPRDHPDQETGAWPTQSDHDWQHVKDVWDAIPLEESAVQIVMAAVFGAGITLAGLIAIAWMFGPAAIPAIVGSRAASLLGGAALAGALGTAVTQLSDGFEIALRANGKREDIEQARKKITAGCVALAALVGARSLGGAKGSGGRVEIVTEEEFAANGRLALPPGAANALPGPAMGPDVPARMPAPTAPANRGLRLLQEETGQFNPLWWRSSKAKKPGAEPRKLVKKAPQPDAVTDRLDATPNLAIFEESKSFYDGAQTRLNPQAKANKIVAVLNAQLEKWGVTTPLRVKVSDDIPDYFEFSEKEWLITLSTKVVNSSFHPLQLEVPRIHYVMTNVFTRAIQCWEVIRHAPDIRNRFPQTVVGDAIKDTRAITAEQQPRVQALYESMVDARTAAAHAELNAKTAVVNQAAIHYDTLLKNHAPPDQVERAKDAWLRANWAADDARQALTQRPHLKAAHDAGRKVEQEYFSRTGEARVQAADEAEFGIDYGLYGNDVRNKPDDFQ